MKFESKYKYFSNENVLQNTFCKISVKLQCVKWKCRLIKYLREKNQIKWWGIYINVFMDTFLLNFLGLSQSYIFDWAMILTVVLTSPVELTAHARDMHMVAALLCCGLLWFGIGGDFTRFLQDYFAGRWNGRGRGRDRNLKSKSC